MSEIEFIDIYFGPYLPDLGGAPNAQIPGYLTDAVGVRLTPQGYRALPYFEDVASAAAIGGATTFMLPIYVESSTTRNFFALNHSDGKIYESQDEGVTWSDTTPAAGSAPTFPGDFFTFDQDLIYVCQARAAIKRTIASAVGTDFSNLAGSPPTASCGARVRQHAVLGALIGVDNYAIQTSAIGDHEDWPTPGTDDARTKQARRQTLPYDLGIVRAILGGEKIGIVVQDTGLTRMTYEGGDTVYAFDSYETQIGYGKRNFTKFATDGTLWYWYNEHGFFATDGYSVNRLSEGRIEDAIFNNLLSHANGSSLANVTTGQATFDPHRSLVMFGHEAANYQLCWDTEQDCFSWMNETNVQALFSAHSPTSITGGKTSGRTVYNVNQSSRKLQILSGNATTIAMQTGYIEIDPGYLVNFHGAHVIGAGGAVSSYTLSYKAAADFNSCDVAQSGFTNLTDASRGMKKLAYAKSQFFAFRIAGQAGGEANLSRGLRIFYTRAEPSP